MRRNSLTALLAAGLLMGAVMLASAAARENAPFTLPDLPYAADALEPVIDEQTMELHHGRHHRAYVDNLNVKVEEYPRLKTLDLEQVQREISSFDTAVRNNGGGHYNHSLFWTLMAPAGQGGEPGKALTAAIEREFGSMDALRTQFSAAAAGVFGAGWAWLIVRDDGRLAITTTPNQDNPLMDVVAERGTPILALDVWEHAYYLQYRNRRSDYVEVWWQVVDLTEVERRFVNAPARKQG